ncbi:hypothetical protein LB452_02765 [Psychroflexus sp. CAK8W]|uniref:Outer membrane protein beta-barrel domain-containing protein n=1 Tax=Psychroflexus longus TaxID=2873596 RepID=A0ABS7XH31_9FLAO|nr:hypothetical protein [Psychroflexus longus]MBZ9777834.1 hypothetical protein [Psychroflexus longus]
MIWSSGAFESGINRFAIKPSVSYFISERTSIDINFSSPRLNDLDLNAVNSYYNSYAFIPKLRTSFFNKKS